MEKSKGACKNRYDFDWKKSMKRGIKVDCRESSQSHFCHVVRMISNFSVDFVRSYLDFFCQLSNSNDIQHDKEIEGFSKRGHGPEKGFITRFSIFMMKFD